MLENLDDTLRVPVDAPSEPHEADERLPDGSYPRTIVANSSLQFFDLAIDAATASSIVDRYFECSETSAAGDTQTPSLFQVTLDEHGVYYHPVTDVPVDPEQLYAVDGRKALEMFAGKWLPVPFMRVIEDPRDGGERLDEGPSNWTRLFIAREDEPSGQTSYRLVLAVDTALATGEPGSAESAGAPIAEDAAAGRRFRFSADVGDIAWFVTETWVDEWLLDVCRDRARREPQVMAAEARRTSRLDHLAHYLTLLNVLAETGLLPDLQLLTPRKKPGGHAQIGVDLVLDIGASRTCALLCEAASDATAPPLVTPLAIRDLSQPHRLHRGYVSSRIEFARPSFGNEVLSRWSGRTNAFYWPSLARIGDEAIRLGAEQRIGDAYTGLSSPLRYLWDEGASRHVWRFAGSAGGAGRRNSLISGPLLSHLTESGDVVEPGKQRPSTTKPRFSRSSLMTFFAAELIEHALGAINSPDYREGRDKPATARKLARIVLVAPSALQPVELQTLTRRVEAAVRLVWMSHGWSGDGRGDVIAQPAVVIADDCASATQFAFLENEIGVKFRGKARQYFGFVGKGRTGYGTGRSLRIATLDVGGGSTGLAISTYALGETSTIVRTSELVEGFPIGGDDVLKAIVEGFILPAIEQKLADNKLIDARRFMRELVSGETHGRASRIGEFRRRFANELAMPAALALLAEHETLRANEDDRPATRSLRALLAGSPIDPKAAAEELEALASDEGSDNVSCLDADVSFTLSEVIAIARRLLEPVVTNAARAIRNLDCDIVLLSGWLSRMPLVKEMFLDGMPIRPDRIISLHEYRMGSWFPGRLAGGTIDDPKPLAGVGALIASRPSAQISGLPLANRDRKVQTAHLVIGRLGADGRVAPEHVVFEHHEGAAGAASAAPARQATLTIEPPTILGFRRSPLATWPALPLCALALADMPPEQRPRLPIRVTLGWSPAGRDGSGLPWIIRATDADGTALAPTEIALGLKTLGPADGHWLDTGVFAIS